MANVSISPCSHPFIYDPDAIGDPNTHCDPHGCCLPCPYFNNFYGEGKLELLYTALGCIGIIGFFLMIFLGLSFISLPSATNNPVTKKILFPFALSVLLFSAADFFSIDQESSQCVSNIEQATIHNNKLCAAQAFFELSGAYAVALWASVLIINLHMLSVWRSDFVLRHITYFHIPVWIMVFLAVFVPMITDEVASGGFCFISQKASPVFFYFLSFIFPVCLLHLTTLAYMAKVSNRANRRQKSGRMSFSETQVLFLHIKHIIKVQWRAFAGAAFMLVVYVTDVFYFIFSTRKFVITQNDVWFGQWIDCLKQADGDQDYCASYAQVPSFVLQVIVLTLNRSVGVVIFLIFAVKKSFFKEWFQVLTRKPGEVVRRSSASGNRMSSIAKRGRIEDSERGRSKGVKRSPDVRKVEYSPRNQRASRKPGSRHETRETSSGPVTGSVVNMALLSSSSIPASPLLADPTSTPSLDFVTSPPKLHLPPPPPFDPPTSLLSRPKKVFDSSSVASQFSTADVTSMEPAQNDYGTSSNALRTSIIQVPGVTSMEAHNSYILGNSLSRTVYGTVSNASQPSLSQLSDIPSIEVQHVDVEIQHVDVGVQHVDVGIQHVDVGVQHVDVGVQHVDVGVQHVDAEVQHVDAEVQQVDVEVQKVDVEVQQVDVEVQKVDAEVQQVDVEVQQVDVQVSSSSQNDDDDSQPPIAQASDNPSTEEIHTSYLNQEP